MYPRLIRRVQGLLIDSVIVCIVLIVSLSIAGLLKLSNDNYAVFIAFLPLVFLEPILVSVTGGTVGHHIIGLRVRKVSEDRNINIFVAVIRSILKFFVGTVSLVFVLTTKRHQAIHDLLSRSIVVVKYPEAIPAHEALSERRSDTENYKYPGALRRILMIVSYLALYFTVGSAIIYFALSVPCLEFDSCNKVDNVVYAIISVSYWVALFLIPALGWSSKLYGCRRRPVLAVND